MISNQVLQKTLDEVRSITEKDMNDVLEVRIALERYGRL